MSFSMFPLQVCVYLGSNKSSLLIVKDHVIFTLSIRWIEARLKLNKRKGVHDNGRWDSTADSPSRNVHC